MSIYTDCGEAARRLLEDPSLADSGIDGIFTDIDVVNLAGGDKGWIDSPDQRRVALREANQVMGTLFRDREACRYGPVHVPGVGEADYMRVGSKIVYSHPEKGPKSVKTPNGIFKRQMVENEGQPGNPVKRQGRRNGTNRNDLAPWKEQNIKVVRIAGPAAPIKAEPDTPDTREITRLRTELAAAHHRIEALEQDNHRLREHRALPSGSKDSGDVKEAILSVVAELGFDERLSALEKTEASRRKMYEKAA